MPPPYLAARYGKRQVFPSPTEALELLTGQIQVSRKKSFSYDDFACYIS